MLKLPDARSLGRHLQTVSVPTTQFLRLSRFAETEPYWARHAQHRFDDPQGMVPGMQSFGVLYAAQDVETAFCESVLHDSALFDGGRFHLAKAALQSRKLVTFSHIDHRALLLADLSGPGLKRLGLNNDISAGDDYAASQPLSRAIHEARPDIDGIRYVSRQNNSAHCYAVFERSGLRSDGWASLSDDDLRALCRLFNARVVA